MASLHQIVIRNLPTIGYEVIEHSFHQFLKISDVDWVVSDFLSSFVFSDISFPYFVKYELSLAGGHEILVGLVHPDGMDEHGRPVVRVHLLIIDRTIYFRHSLPYWMSPLHIIPEKVGRQMLRFPEDFKELPLTTPVPPKLVEEILLKRHAFYYTQLDFQSTNVLAAYIDKIVPVIFNEKFSILSATRTTNLKKIPSLVFLKAKNDLGLPELDPFQLSSYNLINMLCLSAQNDKIRKEINNKIIRNDLESEEDKKVLELMKLRFNDRKKALKEKYLELQIKMIKWKSAR